MNKVHQLWKRIKDRYHRVIADVTAIEVQMMLERSSRQVGEKPSKPPPKVWVTVLIWGLLILIGIASWHFITIGRKQ